MKTTPRPLVTLKFDSYAKAPKTEAELAALAINAKAAGMKNAEFAGNPDVSRAAAYASAWRVRLEKFIAYPVKRTVIAKLIDGIAVELAEAREAYRLATIDCFLANDHEFKGAADAMARIVALEARLHAAKTAKPDIDRSSPPEIDVLREQAYKAESKFKSILFELKKQKVLQQTANATELQ